MTQQHTLGEAQKPHLNKQLFAETLPIRRDKDHVTYTLTNALPAVPLQHLAERKTQRSFVERSIQDAKSELGWDDLRAIKYRACEHQLALTILASWFVAETRLDWERAMPTDPALLEHYQTDVLPALSMANVREMLRAAMPSGLCLISRNAGKIG